MAHVVLLGDSIFDNAAYVPGGPAVIDQLRAILPRDWAVSLVAVDEHVTADVEKQLERAPSDATHLVVSCGGNDALSYLPMLSERARSVGDVLNQFAGIRADFTKRYRHMLEQVVATGRQVAVCSVYDCIPDLEPKAHAALAMFNEIILREAISSKISIIDLRLVCTERADYATVSPIEPSQKGGAKIVQAICSLLLDDVSSEKVTAVHT